MNEEFHIIYFQTTRIKVFEVKIPENIRTKTFLERFKFFVLIRPRPRSSFEEIMMGRSHQCYIQSFVKIGPPVPERKIFEGFLPYMGVAAILVM